MGGGERDSELGGGVVARSRTFTPTLTPPPLPPLSRTRTHALALTQHIQQHLQAGGLGPRAARRLGRHRAHCKRERWGWVVEGEGKASIAAPQPT